MAKKKLKSPECIDDLYETITRWHIPVFVFALIRGIPTTINIMAIVFVAPHQAFNCIVPEGWEELNGHCYMRPTAALWQLQSDNDTSYLSDVGSLSNNTVRECTQWTYDHSIYAGTTIIEQFNLVCGRRWLISTTQSLYLAGVMVGTILFSHIADWFGRKRSCLISLIWASVTGALMALAPSILWYNILRFLMAVGTSGYSDAAHILVLESVAPRKRYFVTLTVGIGWSIGMVLVPLQAYFLPDWRYMHLVTPIPVLVLGVIWFFMDESARWLMGAGRYSEAKQVLLRIARARGDVTEQQVDNLIDAVKHQDEQRELKTKPTIGDLFSKDFRQPSFIFCFIMMVSYLLWYHVTVSTAGVGTNPYIAFATAASFELPGKALNVLFIRFVRRRLATVLAFGMASIAVVAFVCIPEDMAFLRLACLITCKMCTGVQGSVQRVQISEVYPSVIRALSTGFFVTVGNFAGAWAPFFDDIGYLTYEWVPMVFIAFLCLVSCAAQLGLRETFENVLQDSMSANRGSSAHDIPVIGAKFDEGRVSPIVTISREVSRVDSRANENSNHETSNA